MSTAEVLDSASQEEFKPPPSLTVLEGGAAVSEVSSLPVSPGLPGVEIVAAPSHREEFIAGLNKLLVGYADDTTDRLAASLERRGIYMWELTEEERGAESYGVGLHVKPDKDLDVKFHLFPDEEDQFGRAEACFNEGQESFTTALEDALEPPPLVLEAVRRTLEIIDKTTSDRTA